ncbi:hypothetical protein [Fluviispira sanaruensis]|nr:hypothetical protein [Fluviispira sanaruensis]
MKKIKNKAFYFNLIPFALFICIDGFVNVSFTWILIEKYNSILSLGICLSISSLLCYFIQTKSSLMKSFLLKRTNLFFFLKTFILTLFSLVIFYLNTNDLFQKYWIMGAMIFYNSFIFMSYNLIDGFIAKNILRQKISSSHGSLISQVSTQIGTLLGYTIGGRVFSIYGMTGTIKLILFFLGFILMASFLTLFKKEQDVNKDSTKQNQNNSTLIANKVISLEL